MITMYAWESASSHHRNKQGDTMSKIKTVIRYSFVAWLLSDEIKFVAHKVSDIIHRRTNKQ